jgi:hypothetical protein
VKRVELPRKDNPRHQQQTKYDQFVHQKITECGDTQNPNRIRK